jgi:hypothetical protein
MVQMPDLQNLDDMPCFPKDRRLAEVFFHGGAKAEAAERVIIKQEEQMLCEKNRQVRIPAVPLGINYLAKFIHELIQAFDGACRAHGVVHATQMLLCTQKATPNAGCTMSGLLIAYLACCMKVCNNILSSYAAFKPTSPHCHHCHVVVHLVDDSEA